MEHKKENWAAGDSYERYMGRWSWQAAQHFVKWLAVEPHQFWLDVGCGTGALTRAVVKIAAPQTVFALDPSVDFVKYARQRTEKAHFLAADALSIALRDNTFDAVVSGLALNFIPQPAQALRDMRRVVKPDGLVAAYVWDYAGKMEFLRYFWDAAIELDANAAPFDQAKRFPICQPDPLRQLWTEAGFRNVRIEPLDVATVFANFEDYWEPFMLGNFPAPKYVAALADVERNNLRDAVRAVLPFEADWSIHLISRVWAVRGYR